MDAEVDSHYVCAICCEVLKKPVLLTTCHHKWASNRVTYVLGTMDDRPDTDTAKSAYVRSSPAPRLQRLYALSAGVHSRLHSVRMTLR